MLSLVEKVLVLRSVSMFAETPDELLAEVAAILREERLPAGSLLFAKGDPGQSMYVVVSGKVRVHDGPRTLNMLGAGDVFGEMALLDPEPRIASVTAEEDSYLFRLDQQPFEELMAERVEVARGIIRVLAGYVRARLRDVAQLDSRLRELEQAASGQPHQAAQQAALRPASATEA